MPDEVIKIKIKNEIRWQFEERPIVPKNEWLFALVIFGFAITVFGVILKNYLLVIIVALTAFIIYILKNKAPEFHESKLDGKGLYIDGKIYPYENFESFWIFRDNEISLKNKKRLMPLLIVPFNSEDESVIRKILENHLPEIEEEEPFLDLLQKKFFRGK